MDLPEAVLRTLREILAPLVEADGGVLYVVSPTAAAHAPPSLRLHLSGTCSGCPGVKATTQQVIEPALRAAGHRGGIDVSAGWTVPEGAERIQAP